jgi:CubicO group peptidase (beta-lactamase class C family)
MSSKLALILIALLLGTENELPTPKGHWFGLLKIKSKTYKLYLHYNQAAHKLAILNPKANEIPLDTIFFRNDSLYFRRGDFFSEFMGSYHSSTKVIDGIWIDDSRKKHRVTFMPVNPDTLVGLHAKTSSAFTWRDPKQKDDGLKTCTTSETHINESLLDSLTVSIIRERYPNVHSLIIAKENCLVYEDYFYGWKADDLWLIQSVTKSFSSALMGIAVAKGEVDPEESICNYLKKYKSKACNPANRGITVKHLLTMTTGLDWNELEFDYGDDRNTLMLCNQKPDPFDCVLSRPRKTGDPSFSYNSMNHLLVNQVLQDTKTLKNANELKQRLLGPLGITSVDTGPKEYAVIGDISITPRSMVKFGLLYLNDGKWNGIQVVPSEWVKESTTPKVILPNDESYGYFWWIKKFNVNDAPVECFYAWGYGGQYIFVVPSHNAVVVMTASNWIMDEKKYAFDMMERYILPAIMN